MLKLRDCDVNTVSISIESPVREIHEQLRGLDTFDLGIGEAHYKNLFCRDAEPLFDSYLPLSRAGHLLAVAFKIGGMVKRAIKQHPALWLVVRMVRRLRARLSAAN